MIKRFCFSILVLFLAATSIGAQAVTGFGLAYGTGSDTGKVFIIQEAKGPIPEGGMQLHQVAREFPDKAKALAVVKLQMELVELDLQRNFKLRNDLTAILAKLNPPLQPVADNGAPANNTGEEKGKAGGNTVSPPKRE